MRGKNCLFWAIFGILSLLPLTNSYAVPSLTRQTGLACTECHTVFPELTPLGRSVKLHGYVQAGAKKPEFFIPVCLIAQASYTVADQTTTGVAPFDSTNNNATDRWNIPQQLNLFYGGRIYDNFGGFIQATYDGTANALLLDNSDVRYANSVKLAGRELVYGVTVNNNPTTQDVWNTVPTWSFPFASSFVANVPAASPLITGLGQQVGGISAYGYWNDMVYAEGAVYRTTRNGITMPLAAGSTPPSTNVKGAVPYWRVGGQHEWGNQSIFVGTFGLSADVFPVGVSGPTDNFTDVAVDAQYQYIGKQHLFSVEASYIHEAQERDGSFALGLSSNPTDRLNSFKANATYSYRSGTKWGDVSGTLGYFYTYGTRDDGLYNTGAPFTGSTNGRPDSSGVILEADYLPWPNTKFGVQYTLYGKFNGNGDNYDGFGDDASHNNTLYLYAQWAI